MTAEDKDEGLLPIEALRPGERVLVSGSVELKAALLDLESQPTKNLESQPANKLEARKG